MKILWIVNTIFPYPAEKMYMKATPFGGWIKGLAEELKEMENINLSVATVYNGKNIKKLDDGSIVYYLIPGAPAIKYNVKLEKYWKKINEDCKPDLVHIHGTEFAHGLAFKNACPDVKCIVSIQGLVSVCSDVYNANISSKEIIKNITLRDIIKMDNIFQQKEKFRMRGKNEKELIRKADAILGRTTWDYANTIYINEAKKYYTLNETLRSEFYKYEWNINNIEKHSIFSSQASYPIKGLHYLLKAIAILKNKYPDIKLYIAGQNILENSTLKERMKRTGYAKYLTKLVKKYKLENHVVFTGILNEKQMIERLLKTNVFVLPSAIENSSNSLGEAMLLGMPCVASNTGGTMDMLEHKKEGFLYPYTEPAMCAKYIGTYFEDDGLCKMYGEEAKKVALKRHNRKNNTKKIIEIYNEIITQKVEI